jgi:5'-3' exoribonuclease 2
MNGIIHPCCHPEDGRPPPKDEDEMLANVGAMVDALVARLRPARLLYLAIDGVAPRAKMNQQRTRRFRSQTEAAERRAADAELRAAMAAEGLPVPPPRAPSWDHNVITPGTAFMAKLAVFLRAFVAKRLAAGADGWAGRLVLLSDAGVAGEGEHKLVDFIRRQVMTSPPHLVAMMTSSPHLATMTASPHPAPPPPPTSSAASAGPRGTTRTSGTPSWGTTPT